MNSLTMRSLLFCACSLWSSILVSAEIVTIDATSHPPIAGKEVDWIYGDILLKNEQISVVIAAPLPTRDANLTIRKIGGSILDLTLNEPSNDQLSAFIPTSGRYLFQDPSLILIGEDSESVFWQCRSSKTIADDGTTATVTYRLKDGDSFVEASVRIEGDGFEHVAAFDGIRADKTFDFKNSESFAYCEDRFFRQTIGFRSAIGATAPSWKVKRPAELHYATEHVVRETNRLSWTVNIFPATSPLDLHAIGVHGALKPAMYTFEVPIEIQLPQGMDHVNRAQVKITPIRSDGTAVGDTGILQTDDDGKASTRLIPGEYVVEASAVGCLSHKVILQATGRESTLRLPLKIEGGIQANVIDEKGQAIPVKATIYAVDGESPDFGPDSTRTCVKNCFYSVHGKLFCALDPGNYDIFFSHGPEYNRVVSSVEIKPGEVMPLEVQLDRVVDTTGWVSAELHSHSTPSGDNTSDQFGRVENLLCEHLEFAPCTEHNRISSYVPHLKAMGLVSSMATCTGMELTGNPLPANHQNAFPLHHHPHTQNGGGPHVHANPEMQIERLAMWDDGSEKVVQMNHPNLHQIYGDLDVDGSSDQGFRKMLGFVDVVEVHPLTTLFEDVASNPPDVRKMRIPIFQWMQLLNQGYRIPGVVNTDAHYNHHGSGWLRNWFACSTDVVSEITTEEMIRQAEAGHIVMSSGPFLSVTASANSGDQSVMPGDDLAAPDGTVQLTVSVQCPNWMDVNRVQLFVNGRPSEKFHYTRKSSPQLFGGVDEVVKFQQSATIDLESDAHLIVATIGEGMTMEKVMGAQYGKRPPIAVANPIFVDIDGGGFKHNGDELDLPLPH